MEAGTGFMESLTDIINRLKTRGYVDSLTPKNDHFECESGKYKIYPQDISVDKVVRFENSSDPNDQAIVYAICAPKVGIRGIYVESYGIYQDDLSKEMEDRLKQHPH